MNSIISAPKLIYLVKKENSLFTATVTK